MTSKNPFGDWVREKLFDLRLSQRDLARQAKAVGLGGLSPQFINRVIKAEEHAEKKGEEVPIWERGTVEKIARALSNGRDTLVEEALQVAGYRTEVTRIDQEGVMRRDGKWINLDDPQQIEYALINLRNAERFLQALLDQKSQEGQDDSSQS